MLFYPELPCENTAVYKLCGLLGAQISNDPARPADLCVRWQETTFGDVD